MTEYRHPTSWGEMFKDAPPSALALLEERDRALEDYLQNIAGAPYVPFSFGGATTAVAVSESGDYEVRSGTDLGVWVFRLKTAGTSSTVVDVKVNGVTVGAASVAAAETRHTLDLSSTSVASGDSINVAVTAAGAGAMGLTVLAPVA